MMRWFFKKLFGVETCEDLPPHKTYRCERCGTEYTYVGETMTCCPRCMPSAEYEAARKLFES